MRKLVFILSIPLLLSSCVETVAVTTLSGLYYIKADRKFTDTVSDTKIAAIITKDMAVKQDRKFTQVSISVHDGRVLLTGSVVTKEHSKQAEEIVWKVEGVKEVMNEVEISTYKRNMVYDTMLASQVKSRILYDGVMKGLDVNIEVYDKKVYILGSTDSMMDVKNIATIASRVRGVKQVVSYVRVRDA